MNKKRNNKGMTLIEVIIAMAFFAILALALITVYTSVIHVVGQTRQRVDDNYESQMEIEKAIVNITNSAVSIITNESMTITFTDSPFEIVVDGKTVGHGEDDRFKIFIPNPPE